MKLEYQITHRATGKFICATPDSDTAINLTRMLNAATYVTEPDAEKSAYCYSVIDHVIDHAEQEPPKEVEAKPVREAKSEVTLHLHPDSALPKKYGKKIRAAGGRYSEARGMANVRYVHLPINAGELINGLVRDFAQAGHKSTAMVVETPQLAHAPAQYCVFYYCRDTEKSPFQYLTYMTNQATEQWKRQQEVR